MQCQGDLLEVVHARGAQGALRPGLWGTSMVKSPKKHAATSMTFIIVPMVNVKRGRLFAGGLSTDGGADESFMGGHLGAASSMVAS